MLDFLLSIVQWVWRTHFRIPEVAYWALLVASAIAISFVRGDARLAFGAALAVAVAGIGRWNWHRAQARSGLAVPYMRASSATPERAEEVQRDIQSAVSDRLPAELRRAVHRVPVVVGPEDREYATKLRRRLRARFLVYGRIADSPDGGWSVYPRVVEPSALPAMFHVDPHTAELSVQRAGADDRSSKLPPSVRVSDEEYPHAFANDLAAVLRATLGQLEIDGFSGTESVRARHAEALIQEAIALAPTSTSRQIDRLRIDLFRALGAQDKEAEGLEILRARAEGDSPSPDLLRAYSIALSPMGVRPTARDRSHSRRALELALKGEDEPLLSDMTLHNLINQVMADEQELGPALERIDEFRTEYYRSRWYVLRMFGLRSWLKAEERRKAGDFDAAKPLAAEAAKYYSRAIRRRWRLYPVVRSRWPFVALPTRHPSPILHANLVDARRSAGQHWRGRWNERRFHRLRRTYIERAFRALEEIEAKGLDQGQLSTAFAHLDWASVGRIDDTEASARVWKCIVMRAQGDAAAAEDEWDRERARNCFMYMARAWIWDQAGTATLVRRAGLPGDQPLDAEWATRRFLETYEGPPVEELLIPMPNL